MPLVLLTIYACTSPREFLEMGDYYHATIKSIEKLNKRPSRRQEQVLAESYPHLIRTLNEDIQQASGSATFNKWSVLDEQYRKINTLSDIINSSRVDLKIERQLLTDLRKKSIEIDFGIDRNDSKEYRSFLRTFFPAKEKYLEFLSQPEREPIWNVAYEEINDSDASYNFFRPDIVSKLQGHRLKIGEKDQNGSRQLVQVIFQGFKKDSTVITQTAFGSANASTTNMGIPNSVNDAPPEATFGRKYQPGSDFSFRYTITIKCTATITIFDGKTKSILFRKNIQGRDAWVSQWYKYRSNFNNSLASMSPYAIQWRYKSGSQALNEYDFLAQRYYYDELYEGSNQNLEKKIIAELASFYDYYLREN